MFIPIIALLGGRTFGKDGETKLLNVQQIESSWPHSDFGVLSKIAYRGRGEKKKIKGSRGACVKLLKRCLKTLSVLAVAYSYKRRSRK